MDEIVDARGLSCPQPVLKVMRRRRSGRDVPLEVLVDTDTSRENVIRAVRGQVWVVRDVRVEPDGCRIAIAKGGPRA